MQAPGIKRERHRNGEATLKKVIQGVLTTLGFVWLLWTLYALVAPEPEDKVPSNIFQPDDSAVSLRLDPVAGGHSPASFDVLSPLSRQLGVPLTIGNQVEILVNGDEIFSPMLDAITQADESIQLLTYIYWTGDIADRFAQALGDAARRGVSVKLLLDAFGSRKIESRNNGVAMLVG